MDLAEPVRCTHAGEARVEGHGHLRVEHGGNPLARFLARVLRLPHPAAAAETHLIVTINADGERWHRTIGQQVFETRQYDTGTGELAERFGVLEMRFRLHETDGSLILRQVGAALRLGSVRLWLPGICSPTVEAREDPAGVRRIHVAVRVVAPLVGLVIAYEGTIEIEEPRA